MRTRVPGLARSNRTGEAGRVRVPRRAGPRLSRAARLVLLRVWFGICTAGALVMSAIAVAVLGWPDPTDTDRADTVSGIIMVTVLVGICWLQALVHLRSRRPQRPAGAGQPGSWEPDPLGIDSLRRITDVEQSLAAALDRLAHTDDEDRGMHSVEVADARRTVARAGAALRDLRAQSVAVSRARSAALSPDREHLAAVRVIVEQRLTDGIADCAALAEAVDGLTKQRPRQKFDRTLARVAALSRDTGPRHQKRR